MKAVKQTESDFQSTIDKPTNRQTNDKKLLSTTTPLPGLLLHLSSFRHLSIASLCHGSFLALLGLVVLLLLIFWLVVLLFRTSCAGAGRLPLSAGHFLELRLQ